MSIDEIIGNIVLDALGADVDCASHACAAAAWLPHSIPQPNNTRLDGKDPLARHSVLKYVG
jgi:hypothetical protein